MTNPLKAQFDTKADEIEKLGSSVSEDQATKSPAEGEWSVRDVLCHLSGDAQTTFRDDLDRFLDEDKPMLDLTPGTLAWTEQREKMPVAELAKHVADQYRDIGTFVAGLDEDQLGRIGRIGFLTEFRGSDEIKLSEWVTLIVNFHMEQHLGQLRALIQ